jgi:hypothetical protein
MMQVASSVTYSTPAGTHRFFDRAQHFLDPNHHRTSAQRIREARASNMIRTQV